eukprot:3408941-Pyramimonas_sp.AAC.1
MCTGRRGICSQSQRPHIILSGHEGGAQRTALAAASPAKFCARMSEVIEHAMLAPVHAYRRSIVLSRLPVPSVFLGFGN